MSPVARTKGLPFALRDKCNVNNKDKCEKQILRCAKDDKVGGGAPILSAAISCSVRPRTSSQPQFKSVPTMHRHGQQAAGLQSNTVQLSHGILCDAVVLKGRGFNPAAGVATRCNHPEPCPSRLYREGHGRRTRSLLDAPTNSTGILRQDLSLLLSKKNRKLLKMEGEIPRRLPAFASALCSEKRILSHVPRDEAARNVAQDHKLMATPRRRG